MWALTAVSSLAMCACLAVSVFPGFSVLAPRLASRVTVAVRADARDVIYLSIPQNSQEIDGKTLYHGVGEGVQASGRPAATASASSLFLGAARSASESPSLFRTRLTGGGDWAASGAAAAGASSSGWSTSMR